MLVNKNGLFLISSLYPDTNWVGDDSLYIVDETKEENQELIQKIKKHAPYMELVIEDGEIIDVIPTDRPPEPKPDLPKGPTVGELQKQILELQEYILNQEYEKLLNEGGM
ncbi:hypothetical protein [Tissierella sp.]|uniref:hypothetical protein n=1 Tax=Tissierella sp. TaxID=41274 RepID=UPI0028AAECA3|nr:hypothetical protein [Tissierella sp.]